MQPTTTVLAGLAAAAILAATQGVPTSQAAVDSVTIAAAGDIACDPDDRAYSSCSHPDTAALVAQRGAAAVLPLGDSQYETGNAGDYLDAYASSWGRFLRYTYPVPGNHEYLTAGASGYFDYFSPRTERPGWYAFNVNGWRFYALNTECSKVDCAREAAWMRADVKAHPSRCQALFMHRPRYSSGQHGSSNIPKRFWAIAYNRHFELALAAHDHDYERFAEMDADGNVTSAGIRSFVVGTGGAELRGFRANKATGSVYRHSGDHGVLFVKVSPTGYGWRYVTTDGATLDSGSDTCR